MAKQKMVYLIGSGDLRVTANRKCAVEQLVMEGKVIGALEGLG